MVLVTRGQVGAILQDLQVRGDRSIQVELPGEASRLGSRLVVVAEPEDERAVEGASPLG